MKGASANGADDGGILEHYDRASSIELEAMLSIAFPDGRRLTPEDLAQLDQFHTRGILATAELAERAKIERSTRVLDIGSGIGGPARFLAATYGCRVTGIDLSPSFVAAAKMLTKRVELEELVSFEVGNATNLPFGDGSFDSVMMHHVAMNIADRARLYAGIYRVLVARGRLVTYDVVSVAGDLLFPVPWARDERASFVISADETRTAIEAAGFQISSWTDETATAIAWFRTAVSAPPPANGLSLARLLGPEFALMTGNFLRNLSEERLAIVAVVAERS